MKSLTQNYSMDFFLPIAILLVSDCIPGMCTCVFVVVLLCPVG